MKHLVIIIAYLGILIRIRTVLKLKVHFSPLITICSIQFNLSSSTKILIRIRTVLTLKVHFSPLITICSTYTFKFLFN